MEEAPVGDAWNALADPTRRRILELLSDGEMTAGEIADNFNMAKPSISHHLSVLKNAALIDGEKKGQNIIYTINTTVFQDLLLLIAKFTDHNKNGESL